MATVSDANRRPLLASSVSVEPQGDTATVYENGGARVMVINRTGLIVLRQCDGARTFSDIVDDLAEHYRESIDRDQIQRDVEAFLTTARAKGIVT